MAWDGIYRAKTHHGIRRPDESRVVITCGRRFASKWSPHIASVTCFSCLDKLKTPNRKETRK